MISELLAASNVATVVSETTDPDTGASKVVLRILADKPWVRMMQEALLAAHGDDAFGLEVHKVFFVHDAPPAPATRFSWVILWWGDPDANGTREKLRAVLGRRVAVAPSYALGKAGAAALMGGGRPPGSATPRAPTARQAPTPQEDEEAEPELRLGAQKGAKEAKRSIRYVRDLDDGQGKVFSIALAAGGMPEGLRGRDPHAIIKFGATKGRFKAVVQGVGDNDFSPKRTESL